MIIVTVKRHLETTSMLCTVPLLGLMAGFFWTYSFNVNRALMLVDGETYAIVQSLLNENARHPAFFFLFFGSAYFSIMSTVLTIHRYNRPVFWLTLLASFVYLAGIVFFTSKVHLPLNHYTESWVPSALPTDWQSIRADWNHANDFRVLASASAFVFSLLALFLKVKDDVHFTASRRTYKAA